MYRTAEANQINYMGEPDYQKGKQITKEENRIALEVNQITWWGKLIYMFDKLITSEVNPIIGEANRITSEAR